MLTFAILLTLVLLSAAAIGPVGWAGFVRDAVDPDAASFAIVFLVCGFIGAKEIDAAHVRPVSDLR